MNGPGGGDRGAPGGGGSSSNSTPMAWPSSASASAHGLNFLGMAGRRRSRSGSSNAAAATAAAATAAAAVGGGGGGTEGADEFLEAKRELDAGKRLEEETKGSLYSDQMKVLKRLVKELEADDWKYARGGGKG